MRPLSQYLSPLIFPSPIEYLTQLDNNDIYIKREDLLPFSFGGNKARKAIYFFREILKGNFDTVVTYGSSQSNHCRVIANMCSKYGLKCWIIAPHTDDVSNYNRKLVTLSGANIIECSISNVSFTIKSTLAQLAEDSHNPYFIPGGGHHTLGTEAYIEAYSEIAQWENSHQQTFDYIFHASGTGTTQAGLVIGTILDNRTHTKVIGISIAREADYGTDVINHSIEEYLTEHQLSLPNEWQHYVHFYDHYTNRLYGKITPEIKAIIRTMYTHHGIAFSGTYTAKAFEGMKQYILQHNLSEQKILFLHTGAVPLFFNDIDSL